MKRILFVCTGNICRSPLAEALMRREVGQRGLDDFDVSSAGTGGMARRPPRVRTSSRSSMGWISPGTAHAC
jgi:protein-tyrosine phosphatase